MSKDTYDLIQKLNSCTMLPGSWDKRFIRDLAAKPTDFQLTDRQEYHLKRLAYKYRRQLAGKGVEIVVEANEQQKLPL